MKKLTTTLLILSIIFSNINCKTGIFNEAPNKPTFWYPENNSSLIDIPSKLDWNCIDTDNDILNYEVYFGTENPPAFLVSDIDVSEYFGITVESQETYYWKIIAEDEHGEKAESEVWSFTMGNFPPETPINPVPENNSIDQNSTNISWECTEPDGETLTYDIYFGTTETPELLKEDYTENTYELQNITGNQKYYWKIVAKDSYGNEITGSLWNFTTDFFAPEAIYPIYNEQNAAWFPKLTWNSNNTGNITYDLYLGTSNNPELLASNLTDTTYHSDRLTKEQTYYWKVIAKKEDGTTSESPIWSFKVFGEPQLNSFFDARDGTSYQTVTIGNQTWMAENLKYNVAGSKVYDDDPINEEIYGRLYNWEQIMNEEETSNENPSGVQGIAPEGWHIPSDSEWLELIYFLGGHFSIINEYLIFDAGKKIKESGTEYWNIGNTGNNESGFSAIPGGRFRDGNYGLIGSISSFYSCTKADIDEYDYGIWFQMSYNSDNVYRAFSNQFLSLRCVKSN